MRLGLGLSLSNVRGGAAAPYDPAALSFADWNRVAYAGAPWAGVASAGTSGSRSLVSGGTAPTVGTALNGFDTADFATNRTLIDLATPLVTDRLSASAWTVSMLVYPRAGAAPAGAIYNNAGHFVGDSGGNFGIVITSSGVAAYHYDGTAWRSTSDTGWLACSLNAWHWIDARFNGTNVQIRVDGGDWTSRAAANASFGGSTWRVGRGFGGYGDFLLAELMTVATSLDDATLASLRTSYAAARYGI